MVKVKSVEEINTGVVAIATLPPEKKPSQEKNAVTVTAFRKPKKQFTDGERNDLIDAVYNWFSSYKNYKYPKVARQKARMRELLKKLNNL